MACESTWRLPLSHRFRTSQTCSVRIADATRRQATPSICAEEHDEEHHQQQRVTAPVGRACGHGFFAAVKVQLRVRAGSRLGHILKGQRDLEGAPPLSTTCSWATFFAALKNVFVI